LSLCVCEKYTTITQIFSAVVIRDCAIFWWHCRLF
jgi:hypothetical protein